jgi:hypothetical protein
MTTYSGYQDVADRTLPTSVRALRVLLYLGGFFTLLATAGFLASEGVRGETVGLAIWSAWPGVTGLVLARRLALGGRRRFRLLAVVAGFWILGALGAVGRGDPRGVSELILPVAITVALARRTAREFFRHGN